MSVLELSGQTQIRLPKIKVGLLQKKTRQEIADICRVSERTIRRDIQAWIRTDDFLNWMREVWLEEFLKVDDVEAFRQVTKIMVKTITAKAEITEEISERIEYVQLDVTEDEDEILSKAAAILDKRLQGKQRPEGIH